MVAVAGSAMPVDDGVRVKPPTPNRTKWRMSRALEVAEEVEWMSSFGFRAPYILDRLKIRKLEYLRRLLQIAGRQDLVEKVAPSKYPCDWTNKYVRSGKL